MNSSLVWAMGNSTNGYLDRRRIDKETGRKYIACNTLPRG